jgi:hypothetical protein
MDNYRFIQILQELINSQNNTIGTLNNFLQEAQNSNYSSYSEADYGNLQNANRELQNQIDNLNGTIGNLQSSYQQLVDQINSGSIFK